MGGAIQTRFKELAAMPVAEAMHINFTTRSVRISLIGYRYIDHDTRQHICFIPALDVTGYGKTRAKAEHMLHFGLELLFQELLNGPTNAATLLQDLGWKKATTASDFSRAIADEHSMRMTTNARPGTVARFELAA